MTCFVKSDSYTEIYIYISVVKKTEGLVASTISLIFHPCAISYTNFGQDPNYSQQLLVAPLVVVRATIQTEK